MTRYELTREQAKLILEALTQREIYFERKADRAIISDTIRFYEQEAKRCADLGNYFLDTIMESDQEPRTEGRS